MSRSLLASIVLPLILTQSTLASVMYLDTGDGYERPVFLSDVQVDNLTYDVEITYDHDLNNELLRVGEDLSDSNILDASIEIKNILNENDSPSVYPYGGKIHFIPNVYIDPCSGDSCAEYTPADGFQAFAKIKHGRSGWINSYFEERGIDEPSYWTNKQHPNYGYAQFTMVTPEPSSIILLTIAMISIALSRYPVRV